jgi:hypothetical protein
MRATGFWASFSRVSLAAGIGFCLLWSPFYWLISDLTLGEVLEWGIPFGMIFGLVFGWIMASPMRLESTVLARSDYDAARPALESLLKGMGFKLTEESTRGQVFKPSIRLGLFTGKIVAHVEGERVRFEGPSMHLRHLTALLAEVRDTLRQ